MDEARKLPKVKLPARASLSYTLSYILQRSVGVLGTPLFTRLLTPSEYGLYPLFNTYLGIATVIATLEITGGIALIGMQKFEQRRCEFLSAALGLILTVFSVFSAMYFLFRKSINGFTGLSTPISSLLLGQIFLNAVINLYTAEKKYEYKYKIVSFLSVISSLGAPLIAVCFITLTRYRAEARILGGFITAFSIAFPLFYIIMKKGRTLFSFPIWKYLMKMALPLLPHYISASLILRLGEIAVGRIHGTEGLGLYSVAVSFGLSLTMITNGIISALSPWVLRKLRRRSFGEVREMLYLISTLLSILSLILLAVMPDVVEIIVPEEYRPALLAVYPLALTCVPTFLSNIILQGEMYYERSAISSIPSVIAAAVNGILVFLFLPHADFRAAGIFTLLSYIILLTLNLFVFKRLSGEYPIELKRSARNFGIALLFALVLFFARGSAAIRLALGISLLPVLASYGIKAYDKIRES